MNEIIGETVSLCPECLSRIPAVRVESGENVYLEKTCPEHGNFKTLIWRGDGRSYLDWSRNSQEAAGPLEHMTLVESGCPYDCGLCPEHKSNACTMVMEVTGRCNLRCPVCFASTDRSNGNEPDMATIEKMYHTVLQATGTPAIQLSGGEPTMRNDLPAIVAMGRKLGFHHMMINSNGIRIAREPGFAQRLKDAGTGTIYLQFDGVTDEVYRYTRGVPLFDLKVRAIENCSKAGIGVLLVPTVKPGVNDHELGAIIRFAKKWIPTVRGVHIQPISYIGRYPVAPRDADRLTIPDVISRLVSQSQGEFRPENFLPRRQEDAHCSFSGLFVLKGERLQALTRRCKDVLPGAWGGHFRNVWESSRSFMDIHWQIPDPGLAQDNACCGREPRIYHEVARDGFSVSCMPFQDVWSIDLERVQGCCGHVVTEDSHIMPFCTYYLTGSDGRRLYPGSAGPRQQGQQAGESAS
jgi:7,8-dihydro-6-hydroxymethylpterin dimethyltransferase